MILLMNKITDTLEKREHGIAVFCDLRKAFDSVDHLILLNRLSKLGVGGVELLWFKNYLEKRHQFVQLKNAKSSLLSIKMGVPQGSILGPILFLVYINDLPLSSNLLTSYLFADDTTLYFSHSDIEHLICTVNIELRKITDFFRESKISLHPKKSKFMVFSNSPTIRNRSIDIKINFNNHDEELEDFKSVISQVTSYSKVPKIYLFCTFS
jgi:hypothetical protein